MMKPAVIVPEDQPLTLATLPPGRTQKRLAIAVALGSLVAFSIMAGPLSSFQLPRIDAFVPAYGTAIFVNDLITAVLLFNQFAILRSRASLAIASGYLYAGLMVIPWLLTFPGVFTPRGLLGAGLQSTAWLSVLRYLGFPTFVIAYALLKDADPPKRLGEGSVGVTILSSVTICVAVISALTVLVIASDAYLPPIAIDRVHFSIFWHYLASCLVLWNALAITLLWIRGRSVLDLWLMVALCAYAIEIYLSAFVGPARFSAGWIAARIFGFVSSILVLSVLLYEITTLYTQLLRAVVAQRREREARLITGDAVSASIAHEVKQPLSAMITNADAGLRWLDRSTPDFDKAKAALKRIAVDGHRAGAVIGSIRAMFKSDTRNRTPLDINELIEEVLVLLRSDLQNHRIAVQADLKPQLPQVMGDRVQLQQVLLNLITNAIESMANEDRSRILSIASNVQDDGVRISVADVGKGIASHDVDRIFNPLVTTKPGGMGMGLSICRSIIEAHEGRLWVAANAPQGAVFQVLLRADAGRSTGV
jgi:signal transduction histidine kinase